MKMPSIMLMAVALALASIIGCQTTNPTPIISPGTVTIAEQIALDFAQAALNGAEVSGKITPAEYAAAEGILVKIDSDLTTGQGMITQAQVDQLIGQALADVAVIFAPAIQPLPPAPAPAMARVFWHAHPLAILKPK